jgi:hypothetical protein
MSVGLVYDPLRSSLPSKLIGVAVRGAGRFIQAIESMTSVATRMYVKSKADELGYNLCYDELGQRQEMHNPFLGKLHTVSIAAATGCLLRGKIRRVREIICQASKR